MTAVDQFLKAMDVPPDAKVKRDQWGRYRIPHPVTGLEQSWTRATTLANTLADRYGLEQWVKRNVVLGIGARSDLYAKAAGCKPDDKDTLNEIVVEAEEAAASKAKANLGTALHRFTERIDAGESLDVPEPWAADVAAYTQAMSSHGLQVVPGWIERILLVPEIQTAGTCDRLLNAMWPLPRIGDLKTGADVIRYGMTEIALQLAIYSRATHWYDPGTGDIHEMPHVDQERALVMHLPVGQAQCTIYEVDIAAGWQAVQLAVDVREWRKRKDLAGLLVPTEVDSTAQVLNQIEGKAAYGALLDRTEWVRDRVQAIKQAGHASTLAAKWSLHPEVPTFPKGGPQTAEQVEIVVRMCDETEAEHGIPFGPSDPTQPQVTKSTRKAQA